MNRTHPVVGLALFAGLMSLLVFATLLVVLIFHPAYDVLGGSSRIEQTAWGLAILLSAISVLYLYNND